MAGRRILQLKMLQFAIFFAPSLIQGGHGSSISATQTPTVTATDKRTVAPDFKLPGKQTDGVIKKVMEGRFMEAVARIDDSVRFLYQINTRLNTLSVRLATNADDVTKIEPIIGQFVKTSQTDISQYLDNHGEMLGKHPLETLTDAVADALVLRRLGHVDTSFLRDAILNRLGPRFATLFQIAQENVATLESGIKTHLADVTQILARHPVTLTGKSSAQYHRLQTFIVDMLHHTST